MKNLTSNALGLSIILILVSALIFSCSDNATEPDHHGEPEVMMSYTPNPATVNTEITFTFEVEEGGEHVAVTMVSCEVEKSGTGIHQEMAIAAEPGEVGHYIAKRTFTEASTYELHFEFMHDNEMAEHPFEIQIQ